MVAEEVKPLKETVEGVDLLIRGGDRRINTGLLGKIDSLEKTDVDLGSDIEELAAEVRSLKEEWTRFKWTLYGAALGAGIVGGGVGTIIARALGFG